MNRYHFTIIIVISEKRFTAVLMNATNFIIVSDHAYVVGMVRYVIRKTLQKVGLWWREVLGKGIT